MQWRTHVYEHSLGLWISQHPHEYQTPVSFSSCLRRAPHQASRQVITDEGRVQWQTHVYEHSLGSRDSQHQFEHSSRAGAAANMGSLSSWFVSHPRIRPLFKDLGPVNPVEGTRVQYVQIHPMLT